MKMPTLLPHGSARDFERDGVGRNVTANGFPSWQLTVSGVEAYDFEFWVCRQVGLPNNSSIYVVRGDKFQTKFKNPKNLPTTFVNPRTGHPETIHTHLRCFHFDRFSQEQDQGLQQRLFFHPDGVQS